MHDLLIVVSIAATLIIPGRLLLLALHPQPLKSSWLTLPVSAVLTLALLTATLTTGIILHTSVIFVVVTALLVALSAGAGGWVLKRRVRSSRAAARRGAVDLFVLFTVVAGGVLGYIVRSSMFSDTLYHVAQAEKVAHLKRLGWSNTLQFIDGSAHPGYLIPTFHAWLGVAAPWADTLKVTLLLPVVLVPLAIMAFAGLGEVLVGAKRGALFAALGVLAIPLLGTSPRFVLASLAAYPGTLVVFTVIPVTVALVVAAIQETKRPIALLVCAFIGTLVIAVLHVSYLIFLAISMLAIALGWLWSLPRSRTFTKRVAAALSCVFVAAALSVVALAPALKGLETFMQDQERVAMKGVEGDVDRPAANDTAKLFVGEGSSYRLRADALVSDGGAALAALSMAVLAGAFLRREPLGWLTLGGAALVLGLTQSSVLFSALVGAMGADQARRLGEALPLVLGGVAFAELLFRVLASKPGRAATLIKGGSTIAACGAGVLVFRTPKLLSRGDDPVLSEWPLRMLAALAIGLVIVFLLKALFSGIIHVTKREPRDLSSTNARASGVTTAWAALPLIALIFAALYSGWGDLAQRASQLKNGVRVGELAAFSAEDIAAIRRIPTGSIVLADNRPQTRTSYRVMAIAPVYVVSAPAGHVANTKRNRIVAREQQQQSLIRPNVAAKDRAERLNRGGVDAVVLRRLKIHEPISDQLRFELQNEWREVPHSGEFDVFIRRSVLQR